MKEKIKILERNIRTEIPSLLEPKLGCNVSDRGWSGKPLCKIVKISQKHIWLSTDDNHDPVKWKRKDFEERFEIIGLDIILSDILEWICLIGKSSIIKIELTDLGNVEFKNTKDNSSVYFNTTSKYLHKQSEIFINFLFNLKK